ncbi:MAG: Two component transcriptional regulator, LuxR family (fragment) [Nitrospira sp.]
MASFHQPADPGKTSPRIVLADDNPAMLDMVLRVLEPEFHIVGTVGNGRDLIQAAAELQPDVLIVDISMPSLNGLEAARLLTGEHTGAKIVILTVHEEPEFVEESFVAGAMGYVVKPRLATDLPVAVREALMGRTFVSPMQPPSEVGSG